MSIIGYARVSTADQTPDLQIDALKSAGAHRVFIETASGAKTDRPQLAAALDYLRPGDTLTVWKLDRLARSIRQLIITIDRLERLGCGFRSLTEAIDTTTPTGKLVFHIFGALTEFERSIIRERTIAGLAAAKARGRRGGRPRVMSENMIIAAGAMIRDGSMTIKEIADQLGVSDGTLYKYIPHPRESTES
ncbi:recombinase family protein [Afipia sp. 1NLS2]|uniref:recombinase family protein n=1 Tax=Afipia sp. 1NLS2 TaxID=666684 RepID=UPI0001D9E23E|nr:recombinase family protein [Afipia sp. 1NLS2]EFI50027.1 Resolvase domain protein [Afipia sp. 1NLS2]